MVHKSNHIRVVLVGLTVYSQQWLCPDLSTAERTCVNSKQEGARFRPPIPV